MNVLKHDHKSHGDPNGGTVRRPYWTRAHRDWRVWVGVVLMMVCMIIYLMTNDLARWSHKQLRQPLSVPAGN